MAEGPINRMSIERFSGAALLPAVDSVAVEEPLELRLRYREGGADVVKGLAVTMRTPGDDPELAAGFLFTEGILRAPADLVAITREGRDEAEGNILVVALAPDVVIDTSRLERHFYTTSSCGICGKASLEAVRMAACPDLPREGLRIPAALLTLLPEMLAGGQPLFEHTGGLHAAALFDAAGRLQAVREDVGRHNAVDKLLGVQFLAGRMPLHDRILMVSGRAGLELVQKALMAGIPVMAAVGAPTSLAVRLARAFGMTLVGFLRDGRYNVYSGSWRLTAASVCAHHNHAVVPDGVES